MGFVKQAPNVFTSSSPDLKNDGEWRAYYQLELGKRVLQFFSSISFLKQNQKEFFHLPLTVLEFNGQFLFILNSLQFLSC